jgi:hypothetical protein
MKKHLILFFAFHVMLFCKPMLAQSWGFRLKSKVELRSWDLSSKAMKNATLINGASVKLYKGSVLVAETLSDANGNFEMNIPPDGDFNLMISAPDRDPKKFAISTRSIPPDKDHANFKPSINIVGMIMSKHKKDMKYLGLDQPQVRIEYSFMDPASRENVTGKHNYNFKLNMYDAEYKIIQKFCTANKLGDMALEKKNYSLAKTYYLIAMDIISGEPYPKERLIKAEEGMNAEKANEKAKRQKTKQSPSKPTIVAKPEKNTSVKKSVDTGKSTRKTRQTLGK